MVDVNSINAVAYIVPLVKTLVYLAIGLGSTIGVGYYLFVVKRRRSWKVNVWEKKADGRMHLIGKDILNEKKINKGKQVVYLLRRNRMEVFPPPWESTYRLNGKEYCDYLRIREDDYQPLKKEIEIPFLEGKNHEERKAFIKSIRDKIHLIRKTDKKEVEDKYIFTPVNNLMVAEMKFEAMDYDINMMRINAIDNREKIYADKTDWFQKYGTYLAIGMIIMLIVLVLYFSFDYSQNVIELAMGESRRTLGIVEQVAAKLGGTPPAS